MKRLSVVITNYNYERFVAQAIDSALALRWDNLEVVVVDDGSTDNSLEVIQGYSDRVKILVMPNSTQRVATNRAYEMTTGDVIVFLDSDDILPADLPERVAEIWTAAISKVQFQVQRVDVAGLAIGAPYPDYRPVPTPAQIKRWAAKTTAYPTPPGSGNAYARWFLDRIFPVEASVGDAADSACLAAAPFLGEVVSVPGVIVSYRQHDANDSDLLKDDSRFPREVARARARWLFAQEASGVPADEVDEGPLHRSRELLQLRIAALRVAPDTQPLPGDSGRSMLLDAVRAPFQIGPESLGHRAIVSGWCVAALLAPKPLARKLIERRYGGRR